MGAARRLLPPPHPRGWYVVALSTDLRPGARVTRTFFGADAVVFRTEGGRAVVTRPFCPHMGAHLGHSGRVQGETLRCAFHGFRFDIEGHCVAAYPGARPPPKCQLGVFPSRERNGHILAYYDPEGAPPTWEVPVLESEGYRPALHRAWNLAGHPQETTENSVDVGHFSVLHGYDRVEALEPVVTEGPLLRGRYTMHRRRGGPSRPVTADFAVQVWGLGYSVVDVHVREHDLYARHFVLATPAEDGRIDLRIGLSLRRIANKVAFHPLAALAPRAALERIVEQAVFHAYAADVRQDFAVWEKKTYLERPALAEGDGAIGQYRRWARQFYGAEAPPARAEATAP